MLTYNVRLKADFHYFTSENYSSGPAHHSAITHHSAIHILEEKNYNICMKILLSGEEEQW